jgi:hypothetical protein
LAINEDKLLVVVTLDGGILFHLIICGVFFFFFDGSIFGAFLSVVFSLELQPEEELMAIT